MYLNAVEQRINAISNGLRNLGVRLSALEEGRGNSQSSVATTSTEASGTMTTLTEDLEAIKKDIEMLKKIDIKKEIGKELCVFEATLSRKMEHLTSKLVKEKLEQHQQATKDIVKELVELHLSSAIASQVPSSAVSDDYEINVTLTGENEILNPVEKTEKKRAGRAKKQT